MKDGLTPILPPPDAVRPVPANVINGDIMRELVDEQLAKLNVIERGEFTVEQLTVIFGLTELMVTRMIGNRMPVNAHEPTELHRWRLQDITTLNDVRKTKELSPNDKLSLQREKVAKQDVRAKKLANDMKARTLIPDHEVEQHIAQAFKVLARWVDLLPDVFEKKGYLTGEQVSGFIKTVERAKGQLLEDLQDL